MLCARVVNGIGTGCLNAVVPVWSAEVATHTSRGAFIASEFTLNIFGVVVAYWMEFGLGFVGDGNTQIRWRVSMIICTTALLLQLFLRVVPSCLPNPAVACVSGESYHFAFSAVY